MAAVAAAAKPSAMQEGGRTGTGNYTAAPDSRTWVLLVGTRKAGGGQ